MYYTPQEWLADWSALTESLVEGERQMKAFIREEYVDENEEIALLDGEYDRNCRLCGRRFITGKRQAFLCPDCRRRRNHEGGVNGGHGAQAAWRKKHGIGFPADASPDDVPDVPADDYDSAEEKLKKTAPIETCLVKKKEDTMDTTREEMLKTFPSGSNRLENPEAFMEAKKNELNELRNSMSHLSDGAVTIQKDPEPDPQQDSFEKIHDAMLQDLQIAFRKDKKGVILSLYSTICDISRTADIPTSDMLDRLTRIDAALS